MSKCIPSFRRRRTC